MEKDGPAIAGECGKRLAMRPKTPSAGAREAFSCRVCPGSRALDIQGVQRRFDSDVLPWATLRVRAVVSSSVQGPFEELGGTGLKRFRDERGGLSSGLGAGWSLDLLVG